jgi:hypothetical protein
MPVAKQKSPTTAPLSTPFSGHNSTRTVAGSFIATYGFSPGSDSRSSVYAADWIATHHRCRNRNECPIPAYGFAEADLHNLVVRILSLA